VGPVVPAALVLPAGPPEPAVPVAPTIPELTLLAPPPAPLGPGVELPELQAAATSSVAKIPYRRSKV
jgi:hypothetical protein